MDKMQIMMGFLMKEKWNLKHYEKFEWLFLVYKLLKNKIELKRDGFPTTKKTIPPENLEVS